MAKITIPTSGLWSAISSSLNAMFDEIYGRTGWASYVDTQYTAGVPFVLTANTDTNLPNNAGTVIDSQKPTDVASFYTDGKLTGRTGDSQSMQLFFFATPSAVDQNLEIWIDIGSPVGELYRQTFNFPRGAGVQRGIMYTLPSAYTLATWTTNGGTVRVRSNASCNIYGMTYNITRTHKAR